MISEPPGASAAPNTVIAMSQSRHMTTTVLYTAHSLHGQCSERPQVLEKVLLSFKTQPLGSHPPCSPTNSAARRSDSLLALCSHPKRDVTTYNESDY